MVIAAISIEDIRASTTLRRVSGLARFGGMRRKAATPIAGVRNSRRGTTRARYTFFTYDRRLTEEVFKIHSLSFPIQLIALPEPKDPMIKRMKRNDVGEEVKVPARE